MKSGNENCDIIYSLVSFQTLISSVENEERNSENKTNHHYKSSQ